MILSRFDEITLYYELSISYVIIISYILILQECHGITVIGVLLLSERITVIF